MTDDLHPMTDVDTTALPAAFSRRGLLALLGAGTAVVGLAGCGGAAEAGAGTVLPERDDEDALEPAEAYARLVEGNERFSSGTPAHPDSSEHRRAILGRSQHPFAAVVSCADSRVPPELVFDQGLGDLFVMRTAGQVLDDAVLGTLEYGVEHLHAPLIVVLGHTACGAVKATVEAVEKKSPPSHTHIDALVAAVRPAVDAGRKAGKEGQLLVDAAIETNVERVMAQIKAAPLVKDAIAAGHAAVVGGVYQLSSGKVEWIGEPPAGAGEAGAEAPAEGQASPEH